MKSGSTRLLEAIYSFPTGVPPKKPFVTFSNAVSWIVFQHSMEGPTLSAVLGIGLAYAVSDTRLDERIASAVEQLADFGTTDVIEIRGQFFRAYLDDEIQTFTEKIPAVRLADYRWFDTLDDSLYRGSGLAWGQNRQELCYPRDDGHYRSVTIKRDDLMREFPPLNDTLPIELSRFSIDEVDDWIRSTSHTAMKKARTAFLVQSRSKGLSATFESRWNAIKKNPVGRPKGR